MRSYTGISCQVGQETDSDQESLDSLFDEEAEADTSPKDTPDSEAPFQATVIPAIRSAPPIPGLYCDRYTLLPPELVDELMQTCISTYFSDGNANQVMLFERADQLGSSSEFAQKSGLPPFLTSLLTTLSDLLLATLPTSTHALLFPHPAACTRARQVIINHYRPGEGITPHVDLLDRFGDGIIGVSLGGGCVMRFEKVKWGDGLDDLGEDEGVEKERLWDVYLPSGSVYVMTDEARYEWTHGIGKRSEDFVEESEANGGDCGLQSSGTWIPRSLRVSITFRWLLPGAEVVGNGGPDANLA